VRAVLRSDNPLFDENEMVFGKVVPGSSKTYDLTVKAPKSSLTRTDVIRADISGQGTVKANNPELTLNIEGKAHPLCPEPHSTRIGGSCRTAQGWEAGISRTGSTR
jgi:hypothetical protein